jgi:hypothetical protein
MKVEVFTKSEIQLGAVILSPDPASQQVRGRCVVQLMEFATAMCIATSAKTCDCDRVRQSVYQLRQSEFGSDSS